MDKNPIFYVFDVLAYRGHDLRRLSLSRRHQLLARHLAPSFPDAAHLSEFFHSTAEDMIRAARQMKLEGIIVKHLDSSYETGQRTGSWVKYKTNKSQELVIGGYLPSAEIFDCLLMGYYENKKLVFVGKVRNGFLPAMRQQVAKSFEGLETDACPFSNLPERRNARRGEALTTVAMKKYRWLKPKLVAQIEFVEWTKSHHLRHSRFAGLRDDKPAMEVIRNSGYG